MAIKIVTLPKDTPIEGIKDLPAPTGVEYIPYAKKHREKTYWMMRRDTLYGVVTTTHDAGPIKALPEWEYGGFLDRNKVKIPSEFIAEAHGFFKWAFETRKSEAVVLICIDWDDQFHLFAPSQTASHGGVHYEFNPATDLPEGWAVVGSIHSHCDFSAFHSGVDTHDADKTDGLHITLGHVNREIAEVDVMFAFSTIKWKEWDIEDVITGPQPTWSEFPEEWKDMFYDLPVPQPKFMGGDSKNENKFRFSEMSGDEFDAYLKEKYGEDWEGATRSVYWKTPAISRRVRIPDLRATYYTQHPNKNIATKWLKSDLTEFAEALAEAGITVTFDVKPSARDGDTNPKPRRRSTTRQAKG